MAGPQLRTWPVHVGVAVASSLTEPLPTATKVADTVLARWAVCGAEGRNTVAWGAIAPNAGAPDWTVTRGADQAYPGSAGMATVIVSPTLTVPCSDVAVPPAAPWDPPAPEDGTGTGATAGRLPAVADRVPAPVPDWAPGSVPAGAFEGAPAPVPAGTVTVGWFAGGADVVVLGTLRPGVGAADMPGVAAPPAAPKVPPQIAALPSMRTSAHRAAGAAAFSPAFPGAPLGAWSGPAIENAGFAGGRWAAVPDDAAERAPEVVPPGDESA
jgi:hypothetical protein